MKPHALVLSLLTLLPLPPAFAAKTGEEVFQQTCVVCHHTGLLGAPKLSDSKRWKKLVAEGPDDLIPSALAGIRQMPAKGGNPNLSDLEVARAVLWMLAQHGATHPEPDAEAIQRWRQMADRRKKH